MPIQLSKFFLPFLFILYSNSIALVSVQSYPFKHNFNPSHYNSFITVYYYTIYFLFLTVGHLNFLFLFLFYQYTNLFIISLE